MFKTFFTLIRAQRAQVQEQIADANALTIIDQQLRDAMGAFERSKKALALAIAQDKRECERLEALEGQIADLETRVGGALEARNEELARRGAEAIAALEADHAAALDARKLFSAEIARLRTYVTQAQNRLNAADRGRRLARVAESVRDLRRGRIEDGPACQATLCEAETTLERLRQRQREAAAAEEALDQIEAAEPACAAEQLAAAGFGSKLRSSADDVLARLKAKTKIAPAH